MKVIGYTDHSECYKMRGCAAAWCLPEVKLSVFRVFSQFVSDGVEAPLVLHIQMTAVRDTLQQHWSDIHTHTQTNMFLSCLIQICLDLISSSVPAVVPDAGHALRQVAPAGGDHLVGDFEQQRGHSL